MQAARVQDPEQRLHLLSDPLPLSTSLSEDLHSEIWCLSTWADTFVCPES